MNLPGKWTQGSFQNNFGSRGYYVYIPQGYDGRRPIPLMVMLHGCFQAAQDFANQTGMNIIAEKYGFAVLYPEQGYQDNIWKCWNWFKPENQARDSGELSIVLGMMGEISKSVRVDTAHVYVAGLSAGAAMASNLLACHSDIFAGAGIASGLEYKAATSEGEAHQVSSTGSTHDINQSAVDAVRCTGPRAQMAAVIAFHGKSDNFVNPVNTDHVVAQFTKMNDLLDDGRDDNSQNLQVISTSRGQVPNGDSYQVDLFGGSGQIHIARVLVDGMGHAWSGANAVGQYADPRGPNASEMIWQFLSKYSVHRN